MSRFRIEVLVKPRPGLLDPQGKAIHSALSNLGYAAVDEVRVGKAIYLNLIADSVDQATAMADEMCRKLLANPVTEDFTISAAELPGADVTAGATP